MESLRIVVNRLWPGCALEIYGSFATGLAVPASDVDVVVSRLPTWSWAAPERHKPLNALAAELALEPWVSSARASSPSGVTVTKSIFFPRAFCVVGEKKKSTFFRRAPN